VIQRTLRILVVEDQPLFKQMLDVLITSVPNFELVASVDRASAAGLIDARSIDVALLDLGLPDGDGISLGRRLRADNPRMGVVLLSASNNMHALLELPYAETAGWSYLSKLSCLSAAHLVRALRRSAAGESVLDPELVQQREFHDHGPLASLTPRQRQVVALVAEGLTNTAIAAELGLSRKSVDAHLNMAYTVLGIHSDGHRNPRVEVVRVFLRHTSHQAVS